MRGLDAMSGSLFSYVDIEARIPTGHPIRIMRRIVNEVLAGRCRARSDVLGDRSPLHCAREASAGLAPANHLLGPLRAPADGAMEPLDYNLTFRWFVGLGADDPVWDHSV
jgi:transposase-like protein DUF772